jgi:GT2 family glycosyltransferase/SAM-dependent methyltransferase
MKHKLVSVVIVTRDRKKDLVESLDAFFKSTYKPLEVIVVDNGSRPPLLTWLQKSYPKIKLITLESNLGAAEGRNRGISVATGEYILFSDDDASPDPKMISELVEVFEEHKKAGIVQPLVYDKQRRNILQGAGHDIDLTTGRIKASGVMEEDRGQYEGIREVPMCGCVWMVKRSVINKIGTFDADYFIPYEDSDFSIRARNAGYKLFCFSKAKTYHQGHKSTFVHPRIEWLGITSSERAYRTARNKIIFIRKNSPFLNQLVFFFIFLPLITIAHTVIIISTGKIDVLVRYWMGFLSGLLYALVYPFRWVRNYYRSYDKKIGPFKMYLSAWSDPLPWVADKSAKTILDLACGQGNPMVFLKYRMNFEKSVGVDLFEPYIEEARKAKIHDKYIISDIRTVKFPPKSFDIVLASHVVEHMPKKEAWQVVENMEKIAKKQVIIATPIGEHYHPAVDGNELQIHKSHFMPEEFEKRGYKVLKYGWSWILGDAGLVHKVKSDILRKIIFTLNLFLTPVYFIFQGTSDYIFVAYKNMSDTDE